VVIGTDHNIDLLKATHEANDFCDILRSFNFYSSVREPTRGDSSLDSFLTNVDSWNYEVAVSNEQIADHNHVLFVLKDFSLQSVKRGGA